VNPLVLSQYLCAGMIPLLHKRKVRMRYSGMRSRTNYERCDKTNVAEDIMMAMISPGDRRKNLRHSLAHHAAVPLKLRCSTPPF
jgi:hypothetical protein